MLHLVLIKPNIIPPLFILNSYKRAYASGSDSTRFSHTEIGMISLLGIVQDVIHEPSVPHCCAISQTRAEQSSAALKSGILCSSIK